jgi:hypothetical protein
MSSSRDHLLEETIKERSTTPHLVMAVPTHRLLVFVNDIDVAEEEEEERVPRVEYGRHCGEEDDGSSRREGKHNGWRECGRDPSLGRFRIEQVTLSLVTTILVPLRVSNEFSN